MTDPTTQREWREAVDTAELLLLVDSAAKYGLITHTLDIDVDRCEQILAAGQTMGIRPRPHDVLLAEGIRRTGR